MFKLSMTAKAINKITKALADAGTVAETVEQRAARALKTHIAFRTNLQAAIPEVAGYLETLDLMLEVLTNPASNVWQKQNAQTGITGIERIIEMFDSKDQFWLNDYIASKLGKNLANAAQGGTKTATPGSSKGSLRNPFPQLPAPPSSDVTPTSGRTPTPPPPTTPNTSTGRYRP